MSQSVAIGTLSAVTLLCSLSALAESLSDSSWSSHFQSTVITQSHGTFTSPYQGPNSLNPNFEIPTSITATLFVGRKLWQDAYFFANPEELMGSGLSQTHGIGAFPNGEIYRVDDPSPKINLSRLFFQQDIQLGGEKEIVPADLNQFAAEKTDHRFTLVAGKFTLNDYLDDNSYSRDPRSQFLNWALMDQGSWDYAADTRGYTWGIYGELHYPVWSLRLALVQISQVANGLDLNGDIIHANSENFEFEYRYNLNGSSGKVRLLSFVNNATMGNYRQALNIAASTGSAPDITKTRNYSTKYGFGLNAEQALTADLGIFSRVGFNDGATETWSFTEIDRSFSVGASLKGVAWGRSVDTAGIALMIDGLSKDHADYLSAGGSGFILGDGLLSYAPEYITEMYYSYRLNPFMTLSPDFSYVKNPGYNSDRGPVTIYSLRFHLEI